MADFILAYWPYLLELLALLVGVAVAAHAIMSKRDVRAAISWSLILILMPLVGALLYAVFGINRVRINRMLRRRNAATSALSSTACGDSSRNAVAIKLPPHFASMKRLGDSVSEFSLLAGNYVRPFESGDDGYNAMLAAIDRAKRWILLETYIFDVDAIGRQFVDHLAAAHKRGVEIRVLVDAIGSRYSQPPVGTLLEPAGIPHALFMARMYGPHLRSANLRTHRKMMIVDSEVCYMGGMNIRVSFSQIAKGHATDLDTHFEVKGPVVSDLAHVFAGDWLFTTDERLPNEATVSVYSGGQAGSPARAVASGPDQEIERTHDMVMGILAVAAKRVVIATPYFLPDRALIGALAVAARRGVGIDIVLPARSNLPIIDYAVMANLEEVIRTGCRIWQAEGPFDHSKLMSVDRAWAYVGSSNLDPRSFRLNFEIDLEVYDVGLAMWIENHIDAHIANAIPITTERLASRALWQKLRDRICWLGSPYM